MKLEMEKNVRLWVFIILIPKVRSQTNIAQYIPISCMNNAQSSFEDYCYWLSEVIPVMISKNQCAFVKGRNIVDNSALAEELFRDFD